LTLASMFRLGLHWRCEPAMAMRIRELAAQTGTTTRSLRYYEAQGLLPAGRSANGYRVYDGHHVRLVREIRSLQAVGFSLEDVRPFVECLLAGHEAGDDCPASVEVYRRKLADLERHIAELRGVRDRLSERLADLGDASAPLCELLFPGPESDTRKGREQ
jgi:DNA-binding transcriptional MerR regulator